MTEGGKKSHLQECAVSRVIFYILFVKFTQALITHQRVFEFRQTCLLLQFFNLFYHCNSVQCICNSIGQEADVARPCQRTIWWHWIRGQKAALLRYTSYLTVRLFIFRTDDLSSLCCRSDSSETHKQLNDDLKVQTANIYYSGKEVKMQVMTSR